MKTTKEIVLVALFISLLIAVQVALSVVVGVELVTVLMVSFFIRFSPRLSFGVVNGFVLLRCVIFGFFPQVVILYIIYYNFLALVFTRFKFSNKQLKAINYIIITVTAVLCTAVFTLLDDVITPIMFSYSQSMTKAYFVSSLIPMAMHCACVGITIPLLLPVLNKVYSLGLKD